jgi:sigma-B regulation protein RsbU (phosphoserine phosphatase)
MPAVSSFAGVLRDLQELERAPAAAHGPLILEAFTRNTAFSGGAVYLTDGTSLRLAAKSQHCIAPDTYDDGAGVEPEPRLTIPIRTSKDHVGVICLHGDGDDDTDEVSLHAAGSFAAALLTKHRLIQEMREGEFQLNYRLWELETLYDIGLSIAATLNIDALADEVLARMVSLINARRAALLMRDGDDFRVYRSFGDIVLTAEAFAGLVQGDAISLEGGAVVAVPIKGNNSIIAALAAADRETREGVGAFETSELRLLSLFASQVGIALENARLHKEALEKQSMERELELAATIQRDILPKAIPSVDRLDLSTLSIPAKQVGGDYHAFFEREGVLTIMVADVAGKSMPAALLVSAFHAAVQLLFAEGRELGEIATELNKHIHRWSAENKFITMIIVSIDVEAETIEFVNAGHNPCYLLCGGKMEQLKSHGLPIGILGTSTYRAQRRAFPAGSTVILYSDGITEAENEAGEEFENDRLEAVLAQHTDSLAVELRDAIAKAVNDFTGTAAQKDDQTLVIARTLLQPGSRV